MEPWKNLIFWVLLVACLVGYTYPQKRPKSTTKKPDKAGPRNDSVLYAQFLEAQKDLFGSPEKFNPGNEGCKYWEALTRMNNTRFFIYDFIDRKDIETNITVARKFCDELSQNGKYGKWRLARIEKLTTFRAIAQYFEAILNNITQISQITAKDTFYWMDAHFNYTTSMFENSDHEPIRLTSVMLYRHFRPMGIGAHEVFDAPLFNFTRARIRNFQQCLTMSFPWPDGTKDNIDRYPGRVFGHQASFDERACEATQKLSPMCESLNPECNFGENFEKNRNFNYFPIEGYAQQNYTDDGVWVFANRRFLVNLVPRNKDESQRYCESLKTKLYTPHVNDSCLIAYLKLWNIRLTNLHFWTSLKANYTGVGETSRMRFENGTQFNLQLGKFFGPVVLNITSGRADVEAQDPFIQEALRKLMQNQTLQTNYLDLCVSANWAYEYPNETSWRGLQVWNFMAFAFANCRLYMGTICEPLDVAHLGRHRCNWMKGWTENYELALNHTAVIEFGFDGSGIYRSTYKQQFGQHICQTPAKMREGVDYEISLDTLDYHTITENQLNSQPNNYYYYDYLEAYWVVDHTMPEEDWFKNATKDTEGCLVSRAVKIDSATGDQIAFKREVKVVNCLEWHFYLCGPDEFDNEL